MTQHELDTILQSGEGYKTEFKRNLNTDLSKELVAFANASGGIILLGIEDNGTISSVHIDNTLKSKVAMMAHECDPSVEVELETFNNILIVHVPEGKNKPYRCTNGFYTRNGASSIKLSTQEIIAFIQSEGKVKFDELTNKAAKYPDELDKLTINRYKQLSGITGNINDDELLTNLGLVYKDENHYTCNNTAVLFFIKDPFLHIPQSAVNCVAYSGNTKVNILDRKTFNLDIISNIDESITFLKRHLNLSYEITGKQRKEKLEIPEVALREAVVNAVAHRDYFEKGAGVMIEVFDNRVEISNPGGLPKGLKPEDLGKRTLARNPLIAALLNRAKYIEKLGTGIQRIRQEMSAAGLPEPDFQFADFFTVVLNRVHIPEKAIALSIGAGSKRLERIMYLLEQLRTGVNPNIKAISIKLNTTDKSIRRDLLLLEKKGWIISSGTTSNRTYKLSETAVEQLGSF